MIARAAEGRLRARVGTSPADLAAVHGLRALCFGAAGAGDEFDAACRHVVIEPAAGGPPLACYRLMALRGAQLEQSYTARFYDLSALAGRGVPTLEVGRFCIAPAAARDADVLRLAWAAITGLVDRLGIEMLLGCASFAGTDPVRYAASFAMLCADHLAPRDWRPGPRAAQTVPLCSAQAPAPAARRQALRVTPPLLRTYLAMGGKVSDHAVVDRALDTLHVFTGVDVARIPPARQRALRALHAQTGAMTRDLCL